jgi:hypothetical protein
LPPILACGGVDISENFLQDTTPAEIPFLLNKSPNGKIKIATLVGAFSVTCKLIP